MAFNLIEFRDYDQAQALSTMYLGANKGPRRGVVITSEDDDFIQFACGETPLPQWISHSLLDAIKGDFYGDTRQNIFKGNEYFWHVWPNGSITIVIFALN